MATQHDDIDVGHLVRIGLIGTILTIAISYAVTGLDFFQNDFLSDMRKAELETPRHAMVLSEREAADLDAARAAVVRRYTK